jgi:uncharacterized protein YdhG (YjbR/CyaY superfamily)
MTKARLLELRKIISSCLPTAEERISYAIPTYWDGTYIVYFSGYPKHVSIYPVHRAGLEEELAPYLSGKSTARFPNDKPLPIPLIKKLVNALYEDAQKRRKK